MKQNMESIRRIIKEEINKSDEDIIGKESDGMEWIKDVVNIKLAKNENWILVNDIDRESITEGHEIQKYLFDLGYDWGIGDFDSLKDFHL